MYSGICLTCSLGSEADKGVVIPLSGTMGTGVGNTGRQWEKQHKFIRGNMGYKGRCQVVHSQWWLKLIICIAGASPLGLCHSQIWPTFRHSILFLSPIHCTFNHGPYWSCYVFFFMVHSTISDWLLCMRHYAMGWSIKMTLFLSKALCNMWQRVAEWGWTERKEGTGWERMESKEGIVPRFWEVSSLVEFS